MKYPILLLFVFSMLYSCSQDPVSDRSSPREIRGYVTEWLSGKMLDSAKVYLQSTDYVAYTDSIGYYSFENIDYNRYRIIAVKEGYNSLDSLVDYYGGGILTVNFKLRKGLLTASTDSVTYKRENIRYKISNNTEYSAYLPDCCRKIVYSIVKNVEGKWIYSDWQNMDCPDSCDTAPLELMPQTDFSDTLSIGLSGEYKLAFLYGFRSSKADADTVLTNSFNVSIK